MNSNFLVKRDTMVIVCGGGLNVRRAVTDAMVRGYQTTEDPGLILVDGEAVGFIPPNANHITLVRG